MAWSSVEFFESGDEYFRRMLEEFGRAQKSITLEFYIFHLDRLGREILTALCECKSRGVEVFMRLDGVGSRAHLQDIDQFCGKEKIELEVFHPLPFEAATSYFPVGFAKVDNFLTRWKLINRRTHRKLVIVDEKVAFTGGMNVAEDQMERFCGASAWHDLALRLEGESVAELVHAFWFRPFRHFTFGNCLLNYSWRLRQARNNWIARAINGAQSKIWVITPYFAPTPTMLFQLKQAARRGVDIRLVLTRKNDVWMSRLAAIGLYRKLLQWGIDVYEYQPTLLHRKLWIIDEIALVGSANFNHRSFIHDLELDVVLREPAHLARTRQLFLGDQKESNLINEEFLHNLGWGKKLLTWIAGWFTYWL